MSFPAALRTLFRPVFRPLPMVGPEGLIMRLSFALLANWMLSGTTFAFTTQKAPTGLARLIDLTFLAEPGAMTWVRWIFAALSVPYVFNLGLSVVLPLMTLLHVAVYSFNNSQGFTHHGNQIVSLVLLAQSLVVLFFTHHRWVMHRPYPLRQARTRDSYLLYYSQVIVAGVYMTSVVSKMRESDGKWVQNLPNISVQLVKTHRQEYYTKPERSAVARDAEVPAAKWMIDNPNLCRTFLGAGLLLEALVFLALANRGWALLIGLALVAMHKSIAVLMRLYFDLNEWVSLIFLINVPFWVCWIWRHVEDRRHHANSVATQQPKQP